MVDIDGSFVYSHIKLIRMEAGVKMNAFPNPARQFVIVKGIEAGGIIEIITVDGKPVSRITTTGNNTSINLGNLASGIYFIRYNNRDKVQLIKIMKE